MHSSKILLRAHLDSSGSATLCCAETLHAVNPSVYMQMLSVTYLRFPNIVLNIFCFIKCEL